MNLLQKQSLDVVVIKTNNDFATVTCKVPNYMGMPEIGEAIRTVPFDLVVGGISTKWIVLFYLKGQYDFGIASEDFRAYVKLISCNKTEVETIRMTINIYLQKVPMSSSKRYECLASRDDESVSVFTKCKNWTGPFRLQRHEDNDTSTGNLKMECVFKAPSND